MNKRTNNLPVFFNYKEEGTDNGYESLQDFFISWTIRCASEEIENENIILNSYAKRILYALIFGDCSEGGFKVSEGNIEDFRVLSVVTKRQIGLIDLIAEVTYIKGNVNKKCILSIENKWYSNIRNQQLEKSAEFVRRIYTEQIIDIVLFCDDEKISSDVVSHCKNNGYKLMTVENLKDFSGISLEKPTNDTLFDEYWLNF